MTNAEFFDRGLKSEAEKIALVTTLTIRAAYRRLIGLTESRGFSLDEAKRLISFEQKIKIKLGLNDDDCKILW